jgi:L-threonylcarbamoyladenylate synthase
MITLNSLSDAKLADLLNQGGVGVLPTDTVYGLVCKASDQTAVKRLYSLKERENKPGTVVTANIDQLVELGIKARYLKAVEQFWPNPLSIIVPSEPALSYLDLGRMSLAVRVPSYNELAELLLETGPLLTSSANLPEKQPANTIEEAQKYFGEQVDFYIDGGDLSSRLPSTLIRIVDDAVEILREGAVRVEESGEIAEAN